MRAELQSVLESLNAIPTEKLPELLGELEVIRATAVMRLSAPVASPAQQHDELLTIQTAAARLGVSTDYLYRHAARLPFTRRIGRKLLFTSLGIDTYIRTHGSNTVLTARQQQRIVALDR